MTANAIDTVVFDLGNVMIPWDPRVLYRKLLQDEAAVDAFLRDICPPAWNAHQDRGRPIAQGVAEHVAQHPEHEALIRAYYDRWNETIGEAIEGSVALMRELKAKGLHVFALTNWSGETFPRARVRFPFLAEFEGIVVSGDEMMIKPEPEIYQVLFERYGIEPTRAVFIDDSIANVEAARAQGMKGIHFRNPEALRVELRELGLPV
ncbi:HAD family hydrolase [Uliginosibacterium sp. sgz301328]|uniref:HAD family hydrolase n=1 Tax=Uliginosibacterium sp. sgz301328 TaxID=3243764 RepID=UPI00359EEEBC